MGNSRYDPFRRHYKKDTRFLLDLYTLTYLYDEGETQEALGDKVNSTDISLLSLNMLMTNILRICSRWVLPTKIFNLSLPTRDGPQHKKKIKKIQLRNLPSNLSVFGY